MSKLLPILMGTLVAVSLGASVATAAVYPPAADPAAINVGQTVPVKVTALITDSSVIPGSVYVQRLDEAGRVTATLGLLRDDGLNGDRAAGDRFFSGAVTLTNSTVGSIRLRVSAALRSVLQRSLSQIITVDVLPPGIPIQPSAPDLTQIVQDSEGRRIVANEVLACFRAEVGIAAIQQIASLVGGAISGRFSGIGNCYQIRLGTGSTAATVQSAIQTLSAMPEVSTAEAHAVRGLAQAQPFSPARSDASFAAMRFPHAQAFTRGAGVTVAVLDTGIHDDPRLQPLVRGANFTTNDPVLIRDTRDVHGHGTHVAGIVRATAPASTLLAIKVCHQLDPGWYPGAANEDACPVGVSAWGISQAVNLHAHVLNMSYGGPSTGSIEKMAIDFANRRGVVLVAAAGNDGQDTPSYPAAVPGVISVGNVDAASNRAFDSNFGPWVKISAHGENILSTFPDADGQEVRRGTSMAAPFVAGTAALIIGYRPFLSVENVVRQILDNAVIPDGWNVDMGAGRLDALAAVTGINHIDVEPGQPILGVGGTAQLLATPRGTRNQPVSLPPATTLSWTSDKPGIAQVHPDTGLVTGVASTVNGGAAQAEITVVETRTSAAVDAYCEEQGLSPCAIEKLEGKAPAAFVNARERVRVTVMDPTLQELRVQVIGPGRVTSNVIQDAFGSHQLDCGSDAFGPELCALHLAAGVELTLTAVGDGFVGWSEPLCSGTDPCVVRMDGTTPKLIEADFGGDPVAGVYDLISVTGRSLPSGRIDWWYADVTGGTLTIYESNHVPPRGGWTAAFSVRRGLEGGQVITTTEDRGGVYFVGPVSTEAVPWGAPTYTGGPSLPPGLVLRTYDPQFSATHMNWATLSPDRRTLSIGNLDFNETLQCLPSGMCWYSPSHSHFALTTYRKRPLIRRSRIEPALRLLTFEPTRQGETSTPQTITITNTGSEELIVTIPSGSGLSLDFELTENGCLARLGPGASCQMRLRFRPLLLYRAGERTSDFRFLTNTGSTDGNHYRPVTFTLRGEATGSSVTGVAPESITFAGTFVGETSSAETITVRNVGDLPLVVNFPFLPSSEFLLDSSTCRNLTLDPGASCSMRVTFRPNTSSSDEPQATLEVRTYEGYGNGLQLVTTRIPLRGRTLHYPPIARVEAQPATVRANDLVSVYGGTSADPEFRSLTYRWRLLSRPAPSAAVLLDIDGPSAAFRVDVEGSYVVELVVNNGRADSAPAFATVIAGPPRPPSDDGPPPDPSMGLWVEENRVHVIGNWRISHHDEEVDDFWIAIGEEPRFQMDDDGFRRDVFFGPGVMGTFTFWEDDDGFPPPVLLDLVIIDANTFLIRLDEDPDPSSIDAYLRLERLP